MLRRHEALPGEFLTLMKSKDYLSVVYNEKTRPRTNYPQELAAHLCRRFQLQNGMTLLDTGCGRGELLDAFARAGLRVTGVDQSPVAVEQLRAFDVKLCDAGKEQFPYPDNSFDVVFSKSVIEHFYAPDHFLHESLRVLKTGGRLIVMTPDWITQMPIFYDDHTHRRPFTKDGLKDLLLISGLNQVESDLFYQLPILWKYPWLKYLSRTIAIFYPVARKTKVKFIRWSAELMLLATGVKPNESNVS